MDAAMALEAPSPAWTAPDATNAPAYTLPASILHAGPPPTTPGASVVCSTPDPAAKEAFVAALRRCNARVARVTVETFCAGTPAQVWLDVVKAR
jgi:hypothetical protein